MHQNTRRGLRVVAAMLLAAIATGAIGVATVLAGGGGPPFPR
jgi:hypothetical protein